MSPFRRGTEGGKLLKRRRRILLAVLAAVAVLAAAGGWLLREGIYLERLPPDVRARIPGRWRIPRGLAPEVRQGIEGLYASETGKRRQAVHALGNLGPDAAPAIPFLVAMLAYQEKAPDILAISPSVPTPPKTWPQRAWDWVQDFFPRGGEESGYPEALRDEGDEAAYALADIGQPAVEPLLAALKDPLPRVWGRAAACRAIL